MFGKWVKDWHFDIDMNGFSSDENFDILGKKYWFILKGKNEDMEIYDDTLVIGTNTMKGSDLYVLEDKDNGRKFFVEGGFTQITENLKDMTSQNLKVFKNVLNGYGFEYIQE